MTLLRIRGIVKRYGTKLNPTIALDGVSFNVGRALNESRRNKLGLSSRTSTCSTPTRRMLMDRFAYLNQRLGATILMVTRDGFTVSYASRVIFLKDGRPEPLWCPTP